MSAIISGDTAKSPLSFKALIEILAMFEPFADLHGATLYAECSKTAVDISARTHEGIVCMECGRVLDARVVKARPLSNPPRAKGAVVVHFCEIHPSSERVHVSTSRKRGDA